MTRQISPVGKHHRRSASQWQHIIDVYAQSELSAKAFCEHHQLGYANFMSWRKRLGSDLPCMTPPNSVGFIELEAPRVQSKGWEIVLKLGDGMELCLSQPDDCA